MIPETSSASDDSRIRDIIDDMAKAVHAKDVDGALAHYTADLVKYDLAPPLQYVGAAALDKAELAAWFATFRGPVGYEIRDLSVTSGDGLAWCHGLARISGSRTDGEETDVWVRVTVCLRKEGGTWKIAHEHSSVPFYMDGSYRAAIDLKP